MAKYPRSNVYKYQVLSFSETYRRTYTDFFANSKKEARQFIARKRQAIKNREWEVNKLC